MSTMGSDQGGGYVTDHSLSVAACYVICLLPVWKYGGLGVYRETSCPRQ